MARQPETQKHYRIHADNIPLEGLGVVLAALEECGVTNVTYEVVTDILAYRHKAAPRAFDVPTVELARTFISQHHTFKAKELIVAFEQEGRSAATGYGALKKLVEAGELRRLEAGQYQSTEIRALPGPEVAAEPEDKPKNGKANRYTPSSIVLVWNTISGRKTISRPEIIDIMLDNDRPKNSVNGIIGKLKDGGKLKSLGDGKYEVMKTKSAKETK